MQLIISTLREEVCCGEEILEWSVIFFFRLVLSVKKQRFHSALIRLTNASRLVQTRYAKRAKPTNCPRNYQPGKGRKLKRDISRKKKIRLSIPLKTRLSRSDPYFLSNALERCDHLLQFHSANEWVLRSEFFPDRKTLSEFPRERDNFVPGLAVPSYERIPTAVELRKRLRSMRACAQSEREMERMQKEVKVQWNWPRAGRWAIIPGMLFGLLFCCINLWLAYSGTIVRLLWFLFLTILFWLKYSYELLFDWDRLWVTHWVTMHRRRIFKRTYACTPELN